MVYSFDIFNTVVTRAVAVPSDVFALVQEKINRENISGLPNKLYSSFRYVRQNAEQIARWRFWREDVGMKDIYQIMAQAYRFPPAIAHRFMELELETEFFLIRPIAVVCDRVRRLISSGEKVIFISDMYLTADFLQSILAAFSIVIPKEDIFVSGDIGVRKITGRLIRMS